jgi:hypothetical protein
MRATRAFALALLAAGTLAGPAHASAGAQVGIADDRIMFGDPVKAASVVQQWKKIGIQTARLHARWVAIAPAPHDVIPPAGFNPADNTDLGYNWAKLDTAVGLLSAAGIKPILSVTGSGPLWGSRRPELANPRYDPDPASFADFAYAVASRYHALVDTYIIWNEPNQPGWLQPQFSCAGGKRCTPEALPAVKAADPGAKVLIGALAPRGGSPTRTNGAMQPLLFLRAMGCVDDRYHRMRTGLCHGFQPLVADGLAYHPHGVLRGPSTPDPAPDEAAIADLPRLEQALDKITAANGLHPVTGTKMSLYLTEFGYQTRPPDPYSGIPAAVQAQWLQQAAYVAWRDPRVKALLQYEWEDEPIASKGLGAKAFAGWQSGLLYANGTPKPAFAVFPHPFWIDMAPGSTQARLWGQVRAAAGATVTILKRSRDGVPWTAVGVVRADTRGYWSKRMLILTSGQYRYTYTLAEDGPVGDQPGDQGTAAGTAAQQSVLEQSAILRVRARVGVVPAR